MRVIKNVNRIYTGKKTQEISDYEIQNRRVAREAAAEGMVLLENCEHILPLQPGSKVALYGSGAVKTIKGGSGSVFSYKSKPSNDSEISSKLSLFIS